jgi:penicillin-binding protein activator
MKKVMFLALAIAILAMGCAGRQVQRIGADTQTDLSGRWNDTDSRLVSEEMIKDSLGRVWLTDFIAAKGKKPVVIVGIVMNKSHELISTDTFIKDMEREYVNSGKVTVVQAAEAREQLRDERADQQKYASPETMKKWGKEKGADFIIQGEINSIVDKLDNKKVVYYQIDLELTNMETNEKVWIGSKKIKKFITN